MPTAQLVAPRIRTVLRIGLALALACGWPRGGRARAADLAVDLSGYRADCGIEVRHEEGADRLTLAWPIGGGESGRLVLDLGADRPLFESLEVVPDDPESEPRRVLRAVDPAVFVTVGSREEPPGRPPEMSPFNVFFDTPADRPHQSYRSTLDRTRARVESRGRRASFAVGELTIGPFRGELVVTLYEGAPLVHVEAVVRTEEEGRAFLYDAGLVGVGDDPGWRRLAWTDTEGHRRQMPIDPGAADRPIVVRHRVLAAGAEQGGVAVFPPPHAYFFPRDLTDNLGYVWSGAGHRGLEPRFGIGIRQQERGGGAFVPWFNAPPGTDQRLGFFALVSGKSAERALDEALRYTRGDRYQALPGYRTFTSHWHMALAVEAMTRREDVTPDLVGMFKGMGVEIVHLAEFHGDGHPRDPGPLRLPELEAMFAECRRLSDAELLLLPGEEANVHLGLDEPGKHPGHWLYLFPRPVYWTMQRAPDQPFVEDHPTHGRLYHVGNRSEMLRLLEEEHGLAWTAHPRIKASSWTPDIYRREDFYLSDRWLGAAWKAMPADLSRPRLGERALDLLDDMANWGPEKYLVGEVDVFKIDHTHELYGHMNINYLRLDRLPRYDDGWQPVLDALRAGRFFVTTGEVLPREFQVGGLESGDRLPLPEDGRPEVRVDLEWTFPLSFAELVSGDGTRVYRDRIDLSDTPAFGRRTLTLHPDLRGRTWVRLEAWDVALNGAFTQPVWLGDGPPAEPAPPGAEPAR